MATFLYQFEWDPAKASTNLSKHGLDFERAATVFLDRSRVRWITMGKDAGGQYALVIHTFEWLADERGRVRLISARRPTKAEIRAYEEHT